MLVVGADEGRALAQEVVELSLAEAVRVAIASDATIYIVREDVRDSRDGIALERAAFLPRLYGELLGGFEEHPPTVTSLAGGDERVSASVGLAGRLDTGMSYELSAGLIRQGREGPDDVLYGAATTTALSAELVQPLRRGAFSAARRRIAVASARSKHSEHQLSAQLERTVGAVDTAYWDLVRARAERDARTSALALATEQAQESKELRRFGTGSDLDIVEAETAVSRRRQELLRAEQEVVEADGRLFDALGVRDGDPGWSATGVLVPTDDAEVRPGPIDVRAQLALARTKRADVQAAHQLVVAESAELRVAEDRQRVAIDLVAAASTTGFAGSLAAPSPASDPDYSGGFGTSLINTFGRDLSFFVGLRFDMPLGAHPGELRHSIQQRAVQRAQLAERGTLAHIESEVRTTVARLAVGTNLVAAADQTVELSTVLLEGTRKRFRSGTATTFDVLRVSEELTRARIEAARARAEHRASMTRLALATGSLLDSFGIDLSTLGASPGTPPP